MRDSPDINRAVVTIDPIIVTTAIALVLLLL
jgi:hypothetical protein